MSDNAYKRLSSGPTKKRHSKGIKPNPEAGKKKGVLKSGNALHHRDGNDDDIMASFPQYCANCEKQIITPDHTVLFCSKECSRQDRLSRPTSSVSTDMSPPRTPISESYSFESLYRHPQILQQRSPTLPYHPTNRFSLSSASSIERQHSDEDVRPRITREPSDASRWLGSFQSSTSLQDHADEHEQATARRRATGRGHSATPSLSGTPSTYSTTGMSLPYTPRSVNNNNNNNNDNTIPYPAHAGPLPSRSNPYSPSAYAPKSVNLVQPMTALSMTAPERDLDAKPRKSLASTGTSADTVVQGEILGYEKKSVDSLREKRDSIASPISSSTGTLKQLFSFAAMQSEPGSPTAPATRRSRASTAFLHKHHD